MASTALKNMPEDCCFDVARRACEERLGSEKFAAYWKLLQTFLEYKMAKKSFDSEVSKTFGDAAYLHNRLILAMMRSSAARAIKPSVVEVHASRAKQAKRGPRIRLKKASKDGKDGKDQEKAQSEGEDASKAAQAKSKSKKKGKAGQDAAKAAVDPKTGASVTGAQGTPIAGASGADAATGAAASKKSKKSKTKAGAAAAGAEGTGTGVSVAGKIKKGSAAKKDTGSSMAGAAVAAVASAAAAKAAGGTDSGLGDKGQAVPAKKLSKKERAAQKAEKEAAKKEAKAKQAEKNRLRKEAQQKARKEAANKEKEKQAGQKRAREDQPNKKEKVQLLVDKPQEHPFVKYIPAEISYDEYRACDGADFFDSSLQLPSFVGLHTLVLNRAQQFGVPTVAVESTRYIVESLESYLKTIIRRMISGMNIRRNVMPCTPRLPEALLRQEVQAAIDMPQSAEHHRWGAWKSDKVLPGDLVLLSTTPKLLMQDKALFLEKLAAMQRTT